MELRSLLSLIALRIYSTTRAVIRAVGLSKPLRRKLGPITARFIYRFTTKDNEPVELHGHRLVLAPPGRYPSPDMLAGNYETGTVTLLEQLLKPGMVFLDVGANIGFFTVLAARLVGTSGAVYAFEPEPSNFQLLSKNIQANYYENIHPLQSAVSNYTGTIELHVSKLDNGSHSINREAARGVADTVHVATTTLDEFLESADVTSVDILKIDVEGAELSVLEGMSKLLRMFPNTTLLIEYCPFLIQVSGNVPSDLLERLSKHGYLVNIVDDQRGPLPLDSIDFESLTSRLLRDESYVNLWCSRP